jgi:hypothetical protein
MPFNCGATHSLPFLWEFSAEASREVAASPALVADWPELMQLACMG